MPRKKNRTTYPHPCGILVHTREPTERERWIDLRPGAQNPTAPTKSCGVEIVDDADGSRHMASAHRDLWRTIQVLVEIALERARSAH